MSFFRWEDGEEKFTKQVAFIKSYILEHYGVIQGDDTSVLTEAMHVYWRMEGYEYDPEEGAFLMPDEEGNYHTFVSDENGVWLVPFPAEEQNKTAAEIHDYLHRTKDAMKRAGVKPIERA